jgi:hypothetical protein
MIDFSGLGEPQLIEKVNARAAVPPNWDRLESQSNAIYTHQQWRSPSTKTGIGIAHLRLPFPISTSMLRWIAKREYTKKGNDGRILAEWKDDLGRPWFDAENDKYRVRGYAVVGLGSIADPEVVRAIARVSADSNYTIVSNFLDELFLIL